MFKKYSYFFILTLLGILTFGGCYMTDRSLKGDSAISVSKITSNFWKITKPDEPTSYLLGSLHLGKPEDELPVPIEQAIKEVDHVYTEIKFDDPIDPDYVEFTQKMFDTESGKTVIDKIGQKRFNAVKKIFEKTFKEGEAKIKNQQLDMEKLIHMQPWMLSLLLQQVLLEKNFSREKGIDFMVFSKATTLKKSLHSLENHMFRYYIFKEQPLNLILSDIDQVIDNQAFAELGINTMYMFYHSGKHFDEIGMLYYHPQKSVFSILQSKEALASKKWFRQELLEKRNLHWVPTILSALPKQKNIFVVGLMHLYGPTGMVEQLKKNGYTLTPIHLGKTGH